MTTHISVFHIAKSIEDIVRFLERWAKKPNAFWIRLFEEDNDAPKLADYLQLVEVEDGSVEIFFFDSRHPRINRYFDQFAVFSVRLSVMTTDETEVSIAFRPADHWEFIGWLEKLYVAFKQHGKFQEDYSETAQNSMHTAENTEASPTPFQTHWLGLATMSDEEWVDLYENGPSGENNEDRSDRETGGASLQKGKSSGPRKEIKIKVSLIQWAITRKKMTRAVALQMSSTSNNTFRKYQKKGWLYTEQELISHLGKPAEIAWQELLDRVNG